MSGLLAFDHLDLGLRVARHRAEAERAAGYRLLAHHAPELSAVASRLEARCRGREEVFRTSMRKEGESDRVRRLLSAYEAARVLGTLMVRFVCRGRGFVRVLGEAQIRETFLEGPSGVRFARACGSEGGFDAVSDVFRGRNVAGEPCDLRKLPAEVVRALWESGGFRKRVETSVSLCLGRVVSGLAGLPSDVEPFRWVAVRGGVACYVPHPSERSRWWNDSENRRAGEEFLSGLVAEVRSRRLPVDGTDPVRYLPRMTAEALSLVDERAEPSWAVEALRLGPAMLAVGGRAA